MPDNDKEDQWSYVSGYELWRKKRSGKSNRRAESNKTAASRNSKELVWRGIGVLLGVLLGVLIILKFLL